MKRKFVCGLLAIFFLAACGTMNANAPWNIQIKDWNPKQQATFFMKLWLSEKASYDSMNDITDKPADLVKVLKTKREILEKSRIPIRTFVSIVDSGEFPNPDDTDQIITWLRTLQLQLVYGR